MTRRGGVAALIASAALVAGCGSSVPSKVSIGAGGGAAIPRSLLAGLRPIGRGPRFQPALRGEPAGACTPRLGRRSQAHIELFGANRVVLLAAGIGARGPRRFVEHRLISAACFGEAVTLDPTGTVYFRPGQRITLAALFGEWGQTLRSERIASFGGSSVRVYIDGRRRAVAPGSVALTDGAEIVLEVGPYVPPHSRFSFPKAPSAALR
jgi:hypothetical protein